MLNAQKRKGARGKSQAEKAEEQATAAEQQAEELFRTYQFEEASALYSKEIEAARRREKPTLRLEEALTRSRLGENMLRATERVAFIDSTVVTRKALFKAYGLSEECGRIVPTAQLGFTAGKEHQTGETGYINELGNRAFFARKDTAGHQYLYSADRIGKKWTISQRPLGVGADDLMQDYPYMMADGVTLYYAAQGAESLGGYDIFVTRYNAETGKFVKSENIGMPFNSPANDYLYAIDENTGIGLFVTDRGQNADSVCIYRFIPADVRTLYGAEVDNDGLRRAAMIHSLADSRADARSLAAAQERIKKALQTQTRREAPSVRFIINDRTVYTSIDQFRNTTARRIAQDWLTKSTKQRQNETLLDELRQQYHRSPSFGLGQKIRDLELKVAETRVALRTMEKNMRRAEAGR